jgi:hypothetical protein
MLYRAPVQGYVQKLFDVILRLKSFNQTTLRDSLKGKPYDNIYHLGFVMKLKPTRAADRSGSSGSTKSVILTV